MVFFFCRFCKRSFNIHNKTNIDKSQKTVYICKVIDKKEDLGKWVN